MKSLHDRWQWITTLCLSNCLGRLAGVSFLATTTIVLASGPSSHDASSVSPAIQFTTIPVAGTDNPEKLSTIAGHVIGALPGQQIVLYAKGQNTWWVQPFANQPFTKIQSNSNWSNSTHPGTEYAALLVGSDFQPPLTADELPRQGVLAFAVATGKLAFWHQWWFPFTCAIAGALATFVFHRVQLHQVSKKLNLRFEERLAERTRIAQDLHDTLLQNFLSASMQLHVAADQLPVDSPTKPRLGRILDLMGQVIKEGENTVQGLRSITEDSLDLEQAFSQVQHELSAQGKIAEPIGFRVIVEGKPRPLHPIIRDEVYRIGREVLVYAFRNIQVKNIEVELLYAATYLRILVRDDGARIDPQMRQSRSDAQSWLSEIRRGAEGIGGRLKVRSSGLAGTEVELSVPGYIAYRQKSSTRQLAWLARIYPGRS